MKFIGRLIWGTLYVLFGIGAPGTVHSCIYPPTPEERAERQRMDAAEAVQRAERREREKVEEDAKEADCRKDAVCWGDRNLLKATNRCRPLVERMAKYQLEWTDGLLEPKFTHYRWKNQVAGVVTYIGDKIKFQNGFGAWQNHPYSCDFNTMSEEALDIDVRPGRL